MILYFLYSIKKEATQDTYLQVLRQGEKQQPFLLRSILSYIPNNKFSFN